MGEPISTVGDLAGICGHDGTSWEKILIDSSKRLVIAIASAIAQECQLYGWDGDSWEKLQVDANKYLKVTLPIEEALGARGYQYDGTTWRRSNLLIGYNAIWDEDLGGTAAGASYTKSSSAIPAGELWILQACSIVNNTRAVTAATVYIYRASGSYVMLDDTRPCAQYVPTLFAGQAVLRTGDVVTVAMAGTQANDVILAGLVGYKMKVNM
jgi:hypothetical protein